MAQSDAIIKIFSFIVFISSVIIHEVSHGAVAEKLGDPTARLAGRLTLNPLKHLDPFGSVILPLLLMVSQSPFLIGWAKPVPYNPYNLKNPAKGGALIAAAGPASNFFIALVFGILMRIIGVAGSSALMGLVPFFSFIVYINIFLGIFNLVPVPPLDGSKVLNYFLPARVQIALASFAAKVVSLVKRQWLLFLILFIFFFQYVLTGVFFVIEPIIKSIYIIFTGQFGL